MKSLFVTTMEELGLSREFLEISSNGFFFEKDLDKFLRKEVPGIYFIQGQRKPVKSAVTKFASSFGKNKNGYNAVNDYDTDTILGDIYYEEAHNHYRQGKDGDFRASKSRQLNDLKKEMREASKKKVDREDSSTDWFQQQAYAFDATFEGYDFIEVLFGLNVPIVLITDDENDPLIHKLGVHKTTEEKIFDR